MRQRILPTICLPLFLTGCALTSTSSPTAEPGLAITGNVHGGQQPIVGAHVYLLAANTTGYGGNGIAPSTANASISLLTSATGNADTLGNYVLTGSDGSFTITGDYTCTAGQQVYLYALGGNPGAGTNSAAGLMAVLGNCPGPTFSAGTYVWINEVSTVAAAYSFAGFASDATHVSSSGTALAQTGIANAFANAGNLVPLSTGTALTTTPAGNGAVPQTTINTLANILAACVNSTGAASASCSTLLTTALSSGASGTTPTDTATAAINIAHNPGQNTAMLYAIPTPAAAFTPALTAQPNDFTIAIVLSGTGLSTPGDLAVDAAGAVWVTNVTSVTKFSSLGAVLSGTGGFTTSSLTNALGIAIDPSGNAWIVNVYPSEAITELSSSGVNLSGPAGYTNSRLGYVDYISIDGMGDAWLPNQTANSAIEFSSAGVLLAQPSTRNTIDPTALAIDGAGSVWVASPAYATKFAAGGTELESINAGNSTINSPESAVIDQFGNAWIAGFSGITKISPTGTILSGTNFKGGGITQPYITALDGAGSLWATNYNGSNVGVLSNSGVPISGSTGYTVPNVAYLGYIAPDGSGNVWLTSGTSLIEMIGASAPVVTPISAGLPLTPTADGSSKLGTRP